MSADTGGQFADVNNGHRSLAALWTGEFHTLFQSGLQKVITDEIGLLFVTECDVAICKDCKYVSAPPPLSQSPVVLLLVVFCIRTAH